MGTDGRCESSGEGQGPADAAQESGGEDEAPSEPDEASAEQKAAPAEQEAAPAEQEAAPAEPEASTEAVPAASDDASTAQAPAPAEATEEAASTAAAEDWRAPLALQLHRSTQVWGALSAVGAGVQLGFLVAMPFRAPRALSGSVGNIAGWAPMVSGLFTSALLRYSLLRSVSLEKLERSLWAGYGITVGMSVLAFTVSVLTGVIGLALGDYMGGAAAALGIPLSLLTMNITLGVHAEQLKKLRLGKTAQRRSRAPQLLAAGPTGLVLAF